MLVFFGLCLAFFWWIGNLRRQKEQRRRTASEIRHGRAEGLPAPDTAIGQKARDIAADAEDMLMRPPPVHGAARWASPEDAHALLADERDLERGLYLGELMDGGRPTGLPLLATYPGHLLTVAPTGQGKSATQIVENLRRYRGSAVVIDPKGELYDLTAGHRRRFGRVFRLAPYAKAGEPPSARYNPLLDLGSPREHGARARFLAEMLIVRQGDKGAADAAFFENEAVNFLTLAILGVVEIHEQTAQTPCTLAEVLRICALPLLGENRERAGDTEYLEDVLGLWAELGTSALVRRQASAFRGRHPKLLSSFLSELNSNLAFLDGHPGFAEVMADSDFAFGDLACDPPTTVYVTVPLKETHTSFRYTRAIIGSAFAAMEEQPDARDASVLFILDEFAALRDMSFMRDAVAQMRSSGAWFWFFVQDVKQLEGIYGPFANVFLSQTDHQIFFGATLDARTKSHISGALGTATLAYRKPNLSWTHSIGVNDSDSATPINLGGFGEGRSTGQSVNIGAPVELAPRPLLLPFEVGVYLGHRDPGESHPSTTIILSKQAGGYPLKARRRHWRDGQAAPALSIVPARKTGSRP
jgi:type IV secretion system protein VirD4